MLLLKLEENCTLTTSDDFNLITNTFNITTSSITSDGPLHITSNFNSSTLDSGSLIVDGGVSIVKNITLGDSINVLGNLNLLNSNGLSTIKSELLVEKNTNIIGNVNINNNVDIQKKINIGGITTIKDISQSHNSNTGALVIDGGLGVKKNVNIDGNLNLLNSDSSLNIYGDSIFKENLYINKNIYLKGEY